MKKFKVAPQNAKRLKTVIAAAMALTLAVPATAYFSSKASKVEAEEAGPQALTTVTFDKGFLGEKAANDLNVVKSEDVLIFKELTDESENYIYEGQKIKFEVTDNPHYEGSPYQYNYNVVGNQPTIGYDATMGSILVLDDTVRVSEYKKKAVEQGKQDPVSHVAVGTVLQVPTIAESQVQMKNPFVDKDLANGASVSYWVKVPDENVNSSLIVFGIKEEDNRKVKSYDGVTYTPNTAAKQAEKDAEAKLSVQISTNNDFHYVKDGGATVSYTGDASVSKNAGQWVYVTIAMTDDKVVTYVNGAEASNQTVAAAGLMADLADSNTGVFFGGNYSTAAETVNQKYDTVFGVSLDDVSFYDKAVTAEEAAQLYAAAQNTKVAPEPVVIESFDFENGMTGANGTTLAAMETNKAGEDPVVVSDAQKGNVLKLGTGNLTKTSAAILSANPFAGKDLVGATVNYWVKGIRAEKTGVINPTVAISFVDTPKVKDHDKLTEAFYKKEAQSVLFTQTDMDAWYYEAYSTGAYEGLKNYFHFSIKKNNHTDGSKDSNGNLTDFLYDETAAAKQEEYNKNLEDSLNWHMITAVFTNGGIKMYQDGKPISNNLSDTENRPTYFGPRFSDGYYQMCYDGYRNFHRASNNQNATPLMTFLTDPTTSAYVGYMYELGSNTRYSRSYEAYYDDITYYASALTDEQVRILFEGEPPVETTPPTENPGPGPSTGIQDPNGNYIWEGNGVSVLASEGVIPGDAVLLLGALDASAEAASYDTFKNVFAGIQDYTVKDFVIYSVTSADTTVTPNGTFTLTLDIPQGYDANALAVVDQSGKQYAFTLSEDGTKVTIEGVDHFGQYAVALKDMSTDDESTLAARNAYSGKTGDTANIVLPVVVLMASAAALVIVSKKRRAEEE